MQCWCCVRAANDTKWEKGPHGYPDGFNPRCVGGGCCHGPHSEGDTHLDCLSLTSPCELIINAVPGPPRETLKLKP